MAERFASGGIGRRNGAADLADDLHSRRIFSPLLRAFAYFLGNSPDLRGIGHVNQNAFSDSSREPRHLRTKGSKINRNRLRARLKCHLESAGSKIFTVEIEFFPAHRAPNDLKIFLRPSQRMI